MSIYYGVATDYEYSATHKRERLTIWSGGFMSTWEGEALSLPNRDGYMITTFRGDKIRVSSPVGRTDKNYAEIDRLINVALNDYFNAENEEN